MTSRAVKIVTGLIGTTMLIAFVIGLAWRISTDFAGFWVISIVVLAMLVFDIWDDCIRVRPRPD